jgi:hypothetical protein
VLIDPAAVAIIGAEPAAVFKLPLVVVALVAIVGREPAN